MKWTLMVDRGVHKGEIIPIQKSSFLIGRNDECQLRPANPYVSHRHCELLADQDKISLRDCTSTNGTFINSQRVEGQVELHEGDRITIGSLAFVVCQKDARAPIPPPLGRGEEDVGLKPIEEEQPEPVSA